MRKGLLVLITAVQISSVVALRNTCDAKGDQCCDQMSESSEPEQDKMGQRLFKSAKEEPIFPQTLEEFGYEFVITDGQVRQMRDIDTREPFKFEVKEGDRAYNQKRYEALGEVITEYVYKLLEEEVHLTKHFVPVDAKEDEEKSFIFMSDNAMTCDKLMILIHGSGVVRAGQWARRLIINDDLDCGTMLPYIKRATEEGYGVLITNGNENYVRKKKERVFIRGSESPEKHFVYVWNNFISKAAAEAVVVVAHSYGGIVIVEGLQKCEGIMDKVKAVAFTDSVHSLAHQGATKKFLKWMRRNSRNWVSSDLPLNEPVTSLFKGRDCDMVSAGTVKHELTSHLAFESVFKFFEERLRASVDESDNSEDQADTSKDQADTSKDQAETSKDLADTSKDQADMSKDQTDTSKDQADTSKDQADTSKDQADTSKDQADMSKDQAGTSKDQADTSKDQGDTSIDQADTSKDQADTSKDQADASIDQADMSEDQADTSKDQADTSKDQANTSTSVTETTENKDSASSSQDIDMDSSQSQDDVSQMETDNTT